MRRVLDGLVWVFLSAMVVGSFWYFSGRDEPEPGTIHSVMSDPDHLERCRSCSDYLGRSTDSGSWTSTVAKRGMPIR